MKDKMQIKQLHTYIYTRHQQHISYVHILIGLPDLLKQTQKMSF